MAISKEELKEELAISQSAWGDRFELPRDGIDRGSVSFSVWSNFNPNTYEKLQQYILDYTNNLLPETPGGISDEMPTIVPYYDQSREHYANLNYFDPILLRAANHYVRNHQENYHEYQNSQEKLSKKKERTIDRGSVSFSVWSNFNPSTYEKLQQYILDYTNNLLPETPGGISDEMPTIPPYYDQSREHYADLNYYEPFLLQAANSYVENHQENYRDYQKSQEKLDTKKQKGSSTKRASRKQRKQRKVSKQQKRNSRT
jgi:hypothetical protein